MCCQLATSCLLYALFATVCVFGPLFARYIVNIVRVCLVSQMYRRMTAEMGVTRNDGGGEEWGEIGSRGNREQTIGHR